MLPYNHFLLPLSSRAVFVYMKVESEPLSVYADLKQCHLFAAVIYLKMISVISRSEKSNSVVTQVN